MYFDFEDHRPDTPLMARPLTRLEQILLTIIAYLLVVIALIVYPRLPFVKAAEARRFAKLEELKNQQEDLNKHLTFAFAIPKLQLENLPPNPKLLSDESHPAQSRRRPPP